LFTAIVELLAARAHSAPPVLLQFDDIQWCDEASAELLHYVVRMMRHRPMSVVLTARGGELPDNEAIMRVLRGIRRDRWLEEMKLTPLSREDIARVSFGWIRANTQTVFDEAPATRFTRLSWRGLPIIQETCGFDACRPDQ
jgi:hypothetical protein